MFLSDVSIKHPVFATMMMLALVVLGIVSYKRLAIDEYPDITYPVVIAQTSYPGASPLVVEREISLVRVMLELGTDVMAAQQDVQAKVARIRRQLPRDIDDPIIQHFDPNDRPIMSIAMLSAERPLRELTDLANDVVS